jgi:hypothetical protein
MEDKESFFMPGFSFGRGRNPLIILDPDTDEEKILLCNMKEPLSKKDIETEINKGYITKEFLFDQIQRGEQRVKNFLEPYMKLAPEGKDIMTPFGRQYRKRQFLDRRFSYILNNLNERGYKHLSDELFPLIDLYNKSAASSVNEVHAIPSVENICENSNSFSDFEEKIEKLIGIYEKSVEIIKKFNELYKSKVLKKVALNKIKEEEAVNETIRIVTEADREMNKELKRLL